MEKIKEFERELLTKEQFRAELMEYEEISGVEFELESGYTYQIYEDEDGAWISEIIGNANLGSYEGAVEYTVRYVYNELNEKVVAVTI